MHKALYRTYRPQNFDDVVGQKHIVKTLKNQIENNNISHAYLFCGTRGTGKTSTAKIFSRAINCTNDIKPCNECDSCKFILENKSIDIVEIDAASNNSVDDIRELRESVKYSPTNFRYKVYIIDEVHMLSQGAFNALLKTLEEPPSYVIFILATTEPQKIPATILSRCQRFDFKRVSVKDLVSRMSYICEKENVEIEERALDLIARNSQGALRDALSILEQCISFSEDKVFYNDVVDILGLVNVESLFDISNSIINKDTKSSMKFLNEFILWGKDIKNLVDDLINHFRSIMICKVSDDLDDIISLPDETIAVLKNQANLVEVDDLIRILNILSKTKDDIRFSTNQRILVEIAIMKIAQPIFDDSKEALLKRIEALEDAIENGAVVFRENSDCKTDDLIDKQDTYIPQEIISEEVSLIENSWSKILQNIKNDKTNAKSVSYASLLSCVKNFKVNSNILYLTFSKDYEFAKNRLYEENIIAYIKDIIKDTIKREFNLRLILDDEIEEVSKEKDEYEEKLYSFVDKEILEIVDK